MRRAARTVAGTLGLVLLVAGSGRRAFAQEGREAQQRRNVERLAAAARGSAVIEWSARTGLARMVAVRGGPGFAVDPGATTAEQKALDFVASHASSFGIVDAADVRATRVERDALGFEHVRLQELHRGIPIAGAEIVVHVRGAWVTAANGRSLDQSLLAGVETAPALDAEAATLLARALPAGGQAGVEALPPVLEIVDPGSLGDAERPARLAWRVELHGPRLLELVWVDAATGEILIHFNQQPDLLNRQVYTAGGTTTLPGTLARTEGQPATGDADTDAAYQFSGDTHQYFLERHGRDSFDGAGAPLVSTVHYGSGYANAFWDTSRRQAAFGDGLAQDDVVAHEITHGVTQHSANLYYYKQSGALNEAFSDIFGETVDLTNGAGTDTPAVRWLIGEDLVGLGALRNMMDPNAFADPGKLSDPQLACGEFDNGGVHTNSGILNHAFALMVDGGAFNGRTVAAIGHVKAGQVLYRALTAYLTTASDFQDADAAIRQSCADLETASSLSAADCAEVASALAAVEMADPWPCPEPAVTVVKRGTGSGTVVSDPPGIDCGNVCTAKFPSTSLVTLTATPAPDSVFAGWSDGCSGTRLCHVFVQPPATITASFDLLGTTHLVSVTTSGTGTVVSSPPGIECGPNCSAEFPSGTAVTLSAIAPAGFALEAWSGDCSGRESCSPQMDRPRAVGASFAATPFVEAATLSNSVYFNDDAEWGDYDGDGDLDLVLVGLPNYNAAIYRNDGGVLVDSGIRFSKAAQFARWGDYDGDSDLDLLLGADSYVDTGPGQTHLHRNDSGSFSIASTDIVGATGADAAWGDYDNDGDLDVAIAGWKGTFLTRIYRNDDGSFVDADVGLPGADDAALAWGDYDADGDLDLAVCGSTGGAASSWVFRNDGGQFVDIQAGLVGVYGCSLAWADYDTDGDLDLALAGYASGTTTTRLYRNDVGAFVDSGEAFRGVYYASIAWGDYDNDGDPDLLVTGFSYNGSQERVAQLYANSGGTFSEVFVGLSAVYAGKVAWADYDNDGRLDILLLGYAGSGNNLVKLYRNIGAPANSPPSAPGSPTAIASQQEVLLRWQAASDAETPSAGLSYNVRVGTTPDGSQIAPPMADPASGRRRVTGAGNAGASLQHRLVGLPHGRYYWAVQAIDSSMAGSAFSPTSSFAVNLAPSADAGGPYVAASRAPVAFDGSQSQDPEADPLSWLWDFGDGGTATGARPAHTFATAGIFTVTLTVTDAFGATSLATTTVSVVESVFWTSTVGVAVAGSGLTKTAAAGWNAGAISKRAITGNGGLAFVATETTSARLVGLSNGDSGQDYSDIDFAFFLVPGGALYVFEKGISKGRFGSYAAGDVLAVAVRQGVVSYLSNGATLHTSTAAPVHPLVVDTSFYTAGAALAFAVLWGAPPNVSPTADAGGPYRWTAGQPIRFDAGSSADADGSIVSFSWDFGDGASGSGPSPSHAYPSPGAYTATVTVTDEEGASSSAAAQVIVQPALATSDVVWTDVVGVSAVPGNVTKLATDGWNAGASSANALAGDGFVEFTALETDTTRVLGLSHGNDGTGYDDIDFAVGTAANGQFYVFAQGAYRSGAYSSGARFRIEVSGGVVSYLLDGRLLGVSDRTPSFPLLVDTAMYSNGATLINVVLASPQ